MSQALRVRIKKVFDRVVYRYPLLNKVLRNVNRQLMRFTSFRLRPFGTMVVRLKSGVMFKMATNETSSVTKLLFWKGADQYEYTPVFEKLIKRCATFLDVGANTGYYSLLASRVHSKAKVFSLEPARAPYHYLVQNVTLNGFVGTIQHFKLALSDKKGKIEFFELDNPQEYHTRYNLAGAGTLIKEDVIQRRFVSTWVPTETLDSFIAEHKITPVDLIKLDTEGTEHLILNHAEKTLRTHKPIIICETLFHVIESELERIMKTYGYQFYNHQDGKLYKTETLTRDQDNGVRDCLFVHPEKASWVEEFVVGK